MANRRPQGNRRMDFGRNDRGPKNFGRSSVSPWQGGGPGTGGIPNLLPLSGGSTEATLALASNLINLLQPRPNPVPSLLDMPIRRDFGPNMGRYDRGYGPNRMGNQGNFRRTGNYNRAGDRINTNRKPFRPHDGQRQQNKSSPKKDADSKAKNVKESEEETPEAEGDATKPEEKKEVPKTRYDEINSQLLKCHICNKSMWDGRSFENHLNGRAHAIMMQKTAESYALTADTMRQEFKIREMKRTRKSGQQPPRDFYCAMCDLYAADGAIHRTTVGHRKLKKYLHPTCTSCHKEMPTRIELDEHRLTAEHLKTMQEKSEVLSKPKPEVMVISTLNMEQSYVRDDRQRWRSDRDAKKAPATAANEEEDKQGDQEETEEKTENAEGTTEEKTEESEAPKENLDNENTILDYKEGDDLSNITSDMLPVYSTHRGVGRSFLTEFRCVQCTLCRKLLDNEETAEVHLRTWRHHQLFNRMLNDKSGNQLTGQTENGKRGHASEDEGSWKRRKVAHDGDAEEADDAADQNGHHDDAEEKDDSAKDVEGELHSKEPEGDMPGEDDLEDWEHSVDEILKDEQTENNEEEQTPMEQEPEPVIELKKEVIEDKPVTPTPSPVEVKKEVIEDNPVTPAHSPVVKPVATQSPAKTPATPRPTPATPRGRGRGRRRC